MIALMARAVFCALCVLLMLQGAFAQKRPVSKKPATKTAAKAAIGPKVTAIDIDGLRKVLQPGSKPLMINFWATWCGPCVEEFPDLVRINNQYKGKIDFITITLDDLAEIDRDVPKFLTRMKADMPTYLLHAKDEDAAIAVVDKDWAGNLPLTILYKPTGETAYQKKGKVRIDDVTLVIDKLLAAPAGGQ